MAYTNITGTTSYNNDMMGITSSNYNYEYKIGDRVEFTGGGVHNNILIGTEGTVKRIVSGCCDYGIQWDIIVPNGHNLNGYVPTGYGYYIYKNEIKLISSAFDKTEEPKMLQKLTSVLKRILKPEMQKQYRASLRDGNLALTELGKRELLEILAIDKEKELTETAEDIIEEVEKERK